MRVFGHPLHAVLVAFPIGLLTLVPLWDALAWLGVAGPNDTAYFGEIAGVAIGFLAAASGGIDYVRAERSPAIDKLGLVHATLGVTALCLFAMALTLRAKGTGATLAVVMLELAGVATLGATGWCGGELVFRHGVNVRRAPEKEQS